METTTAIQCPGCPASPLSDLGAPDCTCLVCPKCSARTLCGTCDVCVMCNPAHGTFEVDPAELTSGRSPYHGRALLSYDPNLTFADLFEDVEFFDNQRANAKPDRAGKSFAHMRRPDWTCYLTPARLAAVAYAREYQFAGGRMPSFELVDWGNGRTLVACHPASFIGSTWVAFIDTASIPAPAR